MNTLPVFMRTFPGDTNIPDPIIVPDKRTIMTNYYKQQLSLKKEYGHLFDFF